MVLPSSQLGIFQPKSRCIGTLPYQRLQEGRLSGAHYHNNSKKDELESKVGALERYSKPLLKKRLVLAKYNKVASLLAL